MSNIATAPTAVQTAAPQKSGYDGFSTEETHWGYIVRATCASGHRLIPSQSLSLLTGAALIAASIGMWLIPGLLVNGDALIMRMFATVTFLSAAALLLWYASRGVVSEIQIDNGRGEIREVVRNHAGKMSLLACYSFDSIGGVFTEPTDAEDAACLLLRYRNSDETFAVAQGRPAALNALCDRISNDVMVGATDAGSNHNNDLDLAA